MTDTNPTQQPDDTVLGGDAAVPGTAGSAAGGVKTSDNADSGEDSAKPPER